MKRAIQLCACLTVLFLVNDRQIAYSQPVTVSGMYTVKKDKGQIVPAPDLKGDTMRGKALFDQMTRVLRDLQTLRFDCYQASESRLGGRDWKREAKYSVWMKKGNLARVEIRNIQYPEDGTNILYDGRNLWAWFVGTNSTIALDANTILDKDKNVFMTKDISKGFSISHDMLNYGSSVSMPVLYLSKFYGLPCSLEDEKMTLTYMGEDTVNGVKAYHLKVVLLGGQRVADYWISPVDHLPRKMEEKLVLNSSDYILTRERWSNIALNDDLQDSLFAWTPPENWKKYMRPTLEETQDSLIKTKQNLFGTLKNLALLDNKTFNLKDYKGQVVLLVFWRLGCPPCRKEMPALQRLYEKYREKGFSVVGFNHVDNVDLVKSYVEKNGITYPNIVDPSPGAKKIYDEFKANTVPLNCLINREGNLTDLWYGFDPKDTKPEKILKTSL